MPAQPDYTVEIVGPDGEPDMSVAVVGDQVVDLSDAQPGDVLVINDAGDLVVADVVGMQGDGGIAPFDDTTLAAPVRIILGGLAVGETVAYTCPAGKKAVTVGNLSWFNPTGGAVTMSVWVVPAGQSTAAGYQVVALNANAGTSSGVTVALCLEPGDKLVVSGTGMNFATRLIEVPEDSGFQKIHVPAMTNGADNLIYTCPADVYALLSNITIPAASTFSVVGIPFASNTTGGAVSTAVKTKPAGGTIAQMGAASSVPAGNVGAASFTYGPMLTEGDELYLTPGGTGQNAWGVAYEIPIAA